MSTKKTREGFNFTSITTRCKDYYGPYGWLTPGEYAAKVEEEFKRYEEREPLKFRQRKGREYYHEYALARENLPDKCLTTTEPSGSTNTCSIKQEQENGSYAPPNSQSSESGSLGSSVAESLPLSPLHDGSSPSLSASSLVVST